MRWNMIDSCCQLRLEIVQDKCWDLFNNIGFTYQSRKLCFVFYFSFKVEQVPALNYMNVLKYTKKDNKILITMHV
jgi:hypothetical protein